MNKRPDITDATRQRFIDAFCESYKNKPIEKITVKEIAEKAGHNRVTFYQYFRDTYDVVEYMEEQVICSLKNAILENLNQTDLFDRFISVFREMSQSNTSTLELLLTGSNREISIGRIKARLIPELMKVINYDGDDAHIRHLLEYHLAGMLSVFSYWLSTKDPLSEQDLAGMIRTILCNGILPQISQ